jgi:hypothetical protein
MHVPVFELSFDNNYSDFKQYCTSAWLDKTIKSNKSVNVLGLPPNENYYSTIFCLENNIAPNVVDLVGQQRHTTWGTELLIGTEQQTNWDDFNEFLKTTEAGNKIVAPYSIIVPISGQVTINFKQYPDNIINDKTYSFKKELIGDTILSLDINQPYLVPSVYPVDIITKEFASLYVIYRFICPKHVIQLERLAFTMQGFKNARLKQ